MKRIIAGVVAVSGVAAAVVVGLSISRGIGPVDAPGCADAPAALGAFQPADPRRPVPDEPFVDGAGRSRRLADFRGAGVVLNVWATWCAPCVREMPALDRLRTRLAGAGIEVIALSADREGAAVVEAFYRDNGIRGLGVYLDARRRLSTALGAQALPLTVLIDARGDEVGRIVGTAEWDVTEVGAFLRGCLGATSPVRGRPT